MKTSHSIELVRHTKHRFKKQLMKRMREYKSYCWDIISSLAWSYGGCPILMASIILCGFRNWTVA